MPLNMKLVATSGSAVLTIPEDVKADLFEAYTALANQPSSRAIEVEFDTESDAKQFCKYARAYAVQNGLKFYRKPNTDAEVVRFRLYESKKSA